MILRACIYVCVGAFYANEEDGGGARQNKKEEERKKERRVSSSHSLVVSRHCLVSVYIHIHIQIYIYIVFKRNKGAAHVRAVHISGEHA